MEIDSHIIEDKIEPEQPIDPINDIIDYLVRCARISFKNAHVDEAEVKTSDKIKIAHELFLKSPTEFLMQFGKYLNQNHLEYFETVKPDHNLEDTYYKSLKQLKIYHSEESKHKRIRNRRYKALQKLQNETDYFSDTQMMMRDPLLYEQLVGQYLTDEEIRERDGVDRENLTFLNLILETVDRNQMREIKNEQLLAETFNPTNLDEDKSFTKNEDILRSNKPWGEFSEEYTKKQWGNFDKVDTRPCHKPEIRKQCPISAPERRLLREEFLQEMYSSFIEGRDDVDYDTIDNDEQYDDLQQISQDEEDKYFDSETNEVENLEQHMKLVDEYTKKQKDNNTDEDPLDVFMTHLTNRINMENY